MKTLHIRKENNVSTESIQFSDSVLSGVVSTTAQDITVPTDARYVIFSANGDFYVNGTTTAVIPTSATIAGTDTIELNPGIRTVSAGDTLSIIAPIDCVITVAFYSSDV